MSEKGFQDRERENGEISEVWTWVQGDAIKYVCMFELQACQLFKKKIYSGMLRD